MFIPLPQHPPKPQGPAIILIFTFFVFTLSPQSLIFQSNPNPVSLLACFEHCGSESSRVSLIFFSFLWQLQVCTNIIIIIVIFSFSRFQFVYLIFYLMGIGSLLPWNFFITANDVSLNNNSLFIFEFRLSTDKVLFLFLKIFYFYFGLNFWDGKIVAIFCFWFD